jgi:hypothetical protein
MAATRGAPVVLGALAAGAAIAVALGVYGDRHTPTGEVTSTLGFDTMIQMKVWLAVAVGVLALGQLIGALWLYGRLGIRAPSWLGRAHRATGFLAVLVSLPVAYHCLWSLGFQSYDTRVLVHSLIGCTLYGAFVVKVVAVHTRSGPGWLLPVAGGLLFTCFVVVVLTSAGWYLNEFGAPTSTGY